MARLSARGTDRGQLLLVGAFALAVLLVALAFVLNGAAATETLATSGGDTTDGAAALGFQGAVERGVSGLIVAVNRDGGGTASELDAAVADWEDTAARVNAEAGVGTTVAVTRTDDGSRIAQETPRVFTDANATDDWTLATAVTDSRGFRLNVSRASLNTTCGTCFEVVVTDGGDTWRAQVSNASNAIRVRVVDVDGTTTTCSVAAETAVIDLSAGTLAGQPCPWQPFEESLAAGYNVSYVNGAQVNGTYELVVEAAVSDDARYGPGGPTVSPAIYRADVDVTYRTPSLTYTVTVTAEPGAD